MISVADFIKPISSGFSVRSAPQQVNILAWYLHAVKEQEYFTTRDIAICFDAAHVSRPVNIAATIAKLVEKKAVLRSTHGFRLSASSRAEMEKLLPARPTAVKTTTILTDLLAKVTDPVQKTFLVETVVCYNHRAYRAAIVMAWNLAFSAVLDRIVANQLIDFNKGVGTHGMKKAITRREDFENMQESDIIKIARAQGILGKETTKALEMKLQLRNTAAHPSTVVVGETTANEVIFDLVQNVLLKPTL